MNFTQHFGKRFLLVCLFAIMSVSAFAQEPDAATNVTAQWINGNDPINREITVRWDPPASGVIPDSYAVYYTTIDLHGGNGMEYVRFFTDGTEFTIPNNVIVPSGYPLHLVAVNSIIDSLENQQFPLAVLFDPLYVIDPNDPFSSNLILVQNSGLIKAQPFSTLTDTIRAYVYGLPDVTFRYILLEGPTGLSVNENTGEITWVTGSTGIDLLKVRIEAEISPQNIISRDWTLQINTGNPYNVLFTSTPPTNVRTGQELIYDVDAVNVEDPNEPVTYSIEYASLYGLPGEEPPTIDPNTGVFRWKIMEDYPDGYVQLQAYIVARSGRMVNSQVLDIFVGDPIYLKSYYDWQTPQTEVGMEFLNRVFAFTLDGSDSLIRFSLLNAPNGMTIDDRTGEVRWIPTDKGIFTYRVMATNGKDTAVKQFTVEAIRGLRIQFPAYYFVAQINQERSEQVIASVSGVDNPQVRYSLTGAPEGMTIDDNGILRWFSNDTTLAREGTMIPVTITAEYDTLKAEYTFYAILYIEPIPSQYIQPIDWNIPTAVNEGEEYNANWASQIPGMPSVTFKYSLKNEPQGMSIDSTTGLVTWQTTQKGLYFYTVIINASNGLSAEFVYVVFVGDNYVELDGDWEDKNIVWEMPLGMVNTPYLQAFNALTLSDGTTLDPNEYTYTLETAPEGMEIIRNDSLYGWAGAALISWTPELAGSYTVVLKASHPDYPGIARIRFTIFVMGNEAEEKMTDEILSRRRVTSVNDTPASESSLTVYPNPATDKIQVSLRGNAPSEITITDMTGRTVIQGNTATLDVSALSTGMYMLTARYGTETKTETFIINR